jgi:hypothetical protein
MGAMNTSTDTCPSLEDLAAFLDGRLSGDERARVVAHLADCPRCYEVFTETARFQLYEEEEEDADPPERIKVPQELVAVEAREGQAVVIPFRRTQALRWVSSIAAVLAVSLAAIPLYRLYSTMPELSSAGLVNPAVQGKAAQDPFWDDKAERGGPGEDVGLASIPHEVLLGAHALDLLLSLGRNDSDRALNDLAGISTHIGEIGLLPEQAEAYAAIQKKIAEGQPAKDLIGQAEQVEARLPTEEDPFVAFGKWVEAGRLSALAESPDFFKSPKNRRFLRVFLRQEREFLDPEVVKALEEIQETLSEADPSSLPYKDLQGRFEKILTYYQDQSKQSEPG